MTKGRKTAITLGEKTTTALRIAATAGIAATVATAAMVMGAPKFFKKGAIIATGEKTATVATKASRRGSAASFDEREKYIWINGNAAVFAWGREEETTLAKAEKG